MLNLDGANDPTHGEQRGSAYHSSAYHSYYQQHMYHPLLIFDGETDQLLTAVLRLGAVYASRGVLAALKRLAHLIHAHCPEVTIELRADGGFAAPALYEWSEAEGIAYTIGLPTTPRLAAAAQSSLDEAQRQHGQIGEQVRLAGETSHTAGSWTHPRRVVYKTEALEQGPNVRFAVATRTAHPLALYNWYVQRGTPEQWIDDLKHACFADWLSCHRFWGNQFRLLPHATAY